MLYQCMAISNLIPYTCTVSVCLWYKVAVSSYFTTFHADSVSDTCTFLYLLFRCIEMLIVVSCFR